MSYSNLPQFKHTYTVLIMDSVSDLEKEVNQRLADEYLLAGEFRIYQDKYYQPMMHSVLVGESIKPGTDVNVENSTDVQDAIIVESKDGVIENNPDEK